MREGEGRGWEGEEGRGGKDYPEYCPSSKFATTPLHRSKLFQEHKAFQQTVRRVAWFGLTKKTTRHDVTTGRHDDSPPPVSHEPSRRVMCRGSRHGGSQNTVYCDLVDSTDVVHLI